uniref:Uncharacterized protein n=1 Tax=Beihai noda-like virus 19 TaxID=1922472 RepID=A0A1L3KFM0_9VIRU|nr:hypothetical protein 2 [Beihai noda-like virus 19]
MSDEHATMTPQQLMTAVRGKDPLHGLCASRQITDEGCDWLKFALDPFHDLQLDNLRGYPDVNTEPTVIVKVRQAIEISAPKELPEGSNWDCHIALSPIDWAKPNGQVYQRGTPATPGYNLAGKVLPQGADTGTISPAGLLASVGGSSGRCVTGRLDGLLINSVPSNLPDGGDMTFTPEHCPATATSGYQLQNINLDDYLDFDDTDLGVYRLVYSGFEAVNTTAQIKKQGAVTVYEYGHSYEPSQIAGPSDKVQGDPAPVGFYNRNESYAANTFRSPPNTLAEAKIMPGAHTWPAQEGCYCTAKFLGENPFQAATMRNYTIQQNNPFAPANSGYLPGDGPQPDKGTFISPGLVGDAWTQVYGPTSGNVSPAYNAAPATHFSRMSTAGAYFTGLSPESTLLVTWRVGIERLPAANKPTFLALAQPSATFDPNALLLYNLIANHLPPGCPQGWNDLGKWFNMLAGVAKKVIPGAFPLVNTAQMILKGLGASHDAIQTVRNVSGATSARQRRAAQQIQAAQRRRNSAPAKPKAKQAVQNFGAPGQRRPRGVQQFSQMS